MYFQSTFIVLCSLASVAFAVMSQGNLNFTRDYIVVYSPTLFNRTEDFCRAFRVVCVEIAGPKNEHHQLDCVFPQKGPRIHAFCGGIAKNPTGGWIRGQPVFDHTPEAVKKIHAMIEGQPMGKTACLKFKKKHSAVVC
ncbi:BQ5605_C014g07527 [Microbotryum silenes-dioicae]|uniref:BQ5605_C014g07527 protein n=1 Tax=Microbotryum silenes-dioicae TaxID=796604 RepID=A0A2X0MFH3_9BASI|nr:BQ5605_C014g07527 [Microbotryum silenes-dioicae]